MAKAVLERFEPAGVLGVGPLGTIYTATEKATGRKVAFRGFVKPEDADPARWREAIDLYNRELGAAQALDHPNIAKIYEFGEEDGFYYIVSEWFDGEALQMKLDRGEVFEAEQALNLVGQAGRALEYAAAEGFYHGDLTPYNLIVTRDGGVRLVNFGLAHCRPKADSIYRAPEELLAQEATPQADLFVLGILLYQIIGGRHPFAAPTVAETHQKILQAPTPPLRGVTPSLQAIVGKLLAKRVTDRYETWAQVAADIVNERMPPPLPRGAADLSLEPGAAGDGSASLADFKLSLADVALLRRKVEEKRSTEISAKRKRLFLRARIATAVCSLGLVAHIGGRRTGEHVLKLSSIKGDVQVSSLAQPKWRSAALGQAIVMLDVIRTGKTGEVVLALGDGTRLMLAPETTLSVRDIRLRRKSGVRARVFYVEQGAVYSNVRPRPRQQYAIVTPFGTATAKGTEFLVTVDPKKGMEVATTSGLVEASNEDGKTPVPAGQQTEVPPGKKPEPASALDSQHQDALVKKISGLAERGLLASLGRALDGMEDLAVMPVADQVAGIGRAADELVSMRHLKQGGAAAKAQTAMQSLMYALEAGDGQGAYPEELNPKTLEEIGATDEMREMILGQFKDQRLVYYKRVPGGYEFAARSNDEKGTLLVARNGRIKVKDGD